MNPGATSKGLGSAMTSLTAPPPILKPRKSSKPLGEGEFLDAQAKQASAAISSTFHQALGNAEQIVNPAVWVRAHPWLSLGTAISAGLAAAATFPTLGSRDRLRKLLHRNGNGHHPA